MIEHAKRHPAGTFACCPSCRREPMHVTVHGGRCGDPIQTFQGTPGPRHQLICACRRSTALCASLSAAKAEWGERMAQQPLPLPAPRRRRHTRNAA